MKILIIHPSFSQKGARGSEVIAQETYKLLQKEGHDVYFFATNIQPYLENKEWTKYFPKSEQRFSPKWWWNIEAKKNLSKMLDEIKPDIIHIHGTYILSYAIFRTIIQHKIPFVITIHDTGVVCPGRSGIYYKHNSVCSKCKDISPLFCLLHNCIQTKKTISSFNVTISNIIEKLTGFNKKANKFIVPSEALAKYISCKDIPISKIKVIPNFINKDFLNMAVVSNKQDYFLVVGTLSFYKGTDLLFDVLKDLKRDIPFKIIGNDITGNKYVELKNKYNLSNVEFIEDINRLELIKYYKNCLSVIMPSNVFESFGMISIEAGLCAKPSIATKVGGIPEVVEHDKTGLLFDFGNKEMLMQDILLYWNNKKLAKEHGINARKKVLELYNDSRYLNNITKLYKEVVNNEK